METPQWCLKLGHIGSKACPGDDGKTTGFGRTLFSDKPARHAKVLFQSFSAITRGQVIPSRLEEDLAQISCFPEVYAMAGAVASRVVGGSSI